MSCPSTSTVTMSDCFLIAKLMIEVSRSQRVVPASSLLRRAGRLERGDCGHVDKVTPGGAAREIAARTRQSLHNRADGDGAANPFHQLMRDVPGIERREDEHVRPTGNLTVWRLASAH